MLHISNKLQRSRSRSLPSKKIFSRTGKLSKTIMMLRQHPKEIIWNRFFVFSRKVLRQHSSKPTQEISCSAATALLETLYRTSFCSVLSCECVCVCLRCFLVCVCVCDFMCCDSIYWTKHLKKSGVPCRRSIRHSMMAGGRKKDERAERRLSGHSAWVAWA